MRRISVIIVMVLITLCSASVGAQEFWYAANGRGELIIDSTRVLVKFDNDVSREMADAIMSSAGRFVEIIDTTSTVDGFLACSLSTGSEYGHFLDSLGSFQKVGRVEPYYLTSYGSPQVVGEHICIRFKEGVSESQIKSFLDESGAEIDHATIGLPRSYSLLNAYKDGTKTVALANRLHESELVEWAHPDFMAILETNGHTAYDYYHPNQEHLKKVIGWFNDSTVWDFHGVDRPIVVAVLDDGYEAHEDIPGVRVLTGYSAKGGASVTPDDYASHGIACAGIIGASHEMDSTGASDPDGGVISMNPWVHILPVRILADSWTWESDAIRDQAVADAIGWATENGADVMSNSWNYTTSYYSDFSIPPVVDEAIEEAATDTRNLSGWGFLGTPLIFSAGNMAMVQDADSVGWPARSPHCFAVGAVDLDDVVFDYSSYGLVGQVDVVAPSGETGLDGDVWTLDRMDSLGENCQVGSGGSCGTFADNQICPDAANDDIDYLCGFGGTSAAAPVVAGIAALLISADSTLRRESNSPTIPAIYDIIERSAVTKFDADTINPPDVQYGYGRADAFRALLSIRRGDADNDGHICDIADLTIIISYLYVSFTPPYPSGLLGDCDCDGVVDGADPTYMISYLFNSGPAPINPCYEYGD